MAGMYAGYQQVQYCQLKCDQTGNTRMKQGNYHFPAVRYRKIGLIYFVLAYERTQNLSDRQLNPPSIFSYSDMFKGMME